MEKCSDNSKRKTNDVLGLLVQQLLAMKQVSYHLQACTHQQFCCAKCLYNKDVTKPENIHICRM